MNAYTGPSKTSGRGLFSIKDLGPGETIFTLPRPLVTAVDSSRLVDTCSNCFACAPESQVGDRGGMLGGANVKACTGCRTLRYCSKVGNQASWNSWTMIDRQLDLLYSFLRHPYNSSLTLFNTYGAQAKMQEHSASRITPVNKHSTQPLM